MNVFALRSLLPVALVLSLAGCTTLPGVRQPAPPSPKEATQLAVLASPAEVHEKARACQELAAVAGPASVAPLAALLNDEKLSSYARSGLESIRDASAGEALRQALPRLEGRQLAGAVNSLGVRREQAAVSDLRMLAFDPKRGAATEAVAALGLIGTPDAAKVLQDVLARGPAELRVPATHAALVAAELLAKEGNASAAKTLLDAAAKAVPAGDLATVVRNRKAALTARR